MEKYLHEHMARNLMLGSEALQGVNEILACSRLEKAWNTLNNTKTVHRGFRRPHQVSIIIFASESAYGP